MAGRPSWVPGILIKRLGRPAGRGGPWPRRGYRPCRGPAGARPPATPSRPRRRLVVDRPEQIGGLPEILQPQLEEQRLARLAFLQFPADGVVVVVAVVDGVVEDRGVRGEPRDRELLDIAAERAAVQQTAGDVVEPEALAHFVEFLGRFHHLSPWGAVGAGVAGLAGCDRGVRKYDRGILIMRTSPRARGYARNHRVRSNASASFGPQLPRS